MHGVETNGELFLNGQTHTMESERSSKTDKPEIHRDTLGLNVLHAQERADRAARGFTFLDEAVQVSAIDFCLPDSPHDAPKPNLPHSKEKSSAFGKREAYWSSHATNLADSAWMRIVGAPIELRKATDKAIERAVNCSRMLTDRFMADVSRGMVPTSETPFLDWFSDYSMIPQNDPTVMMELIRINRKMTEARNSDADVQEVFHYTKTAWEKSIPDLVDDGVLHPSVLSRLARLDTLKIFVGDNFSTLAEGRMGYVWCGDDAVVVEPQDAEDYASTDGQLLLFHEINHVLGWGGASGSGKYYHRSFDHPIHNEADTEHLAEMQVRGNDVNELHCDTGIYDAQKLLRGHMLRAAQQGGADLTMRDYLYVYSSPYAERRSHIDRLNWELAGGLGLRGNVLRSVVLSAERLADQYYRPGVHISKESVAIDSAGKIDTYFEQFQQLP